MSLEMYSKGRQKSFVTLIVGEKQLVFVAQNIYFNPPEKTSFSQHLFVSHPQNTLKIPLIGPFIQLLLLVNPVINDHFRFLCLSVLKYMWSNSRFPIKHRCSSHFFMKLKHSLIQHNCPLSIDLKSNCSLDELKLSHLEINCLKTNHWCRQSRYYDNCSVCTNRDVKFMQCESTVTTEPVLSIAYFERT